MNNPRREHSAGLLARPGGRAERAAARETASAVRLILRGGQRRESGKKSWSAIPLRVSRGSHANIVSPIEARHPGRLDNANRSIKCPRIESA